MNVSLVSVSEILHTKVKNRDEKKWEYMPDRDRICSRNEHLKNCKDGVEDVKRNSFEIGVICK